ncbi:MAG: right-handed parallel beta-helix repeat-containing protein, partial [Planctomycetota bacterium]
MFEQCSRNIIAENSITHGGDGIFAFAGREALGESEPPEGFSHRRAGNNDNVIVKNDTSYAAAHGIELTFSFGNRIALNRVFENAICGVWGGYSQEMLIAGNHFERNGDAGYGLERGGVNIEHSVDNVIHDNKFVANACGVHLWWDPDPELAKTPWAQAQRVTCEGNRISHNGFFGDRVAIHLRAATRTTIADNKLTGVETPLQIEGGDDPVERVETDLGWKVPEYTVLGRTRPVGNRRALGGRKAIVMTEWGPWDHRSPLVRQTATGGEDVYEVHGVVGVAAELLDPSATDERRELQLSVDPSADSSSPAMIRVSSQAPGLHPYRMRITGTDGFKRTVSGRILVTKWTIRVFRWTRDPREDLDGWRAEAESALTATRSDLQLEYGMGGPRTVGLSDEIRANGPGPDRFGTLAEATVPLAAGRYRVVTWSDDGIRVTANGETVVEDWTWHGPTLRVGTLVVDAAREVRFAVEHFEIDGFATLRVDIEPEVTPSEDQR